MVSIVPRGARMRLSSLTRLHLGAGSTAPTYLQKAHTPTHPQGARTFTSDELWTNYDQAKSWLRCKKLPPDIDPKCVFCNDEINLSEVEVYGFDDDYTLASYKKG